MGQQTTLGDPKRCEMCAHWDGSIEAYPRCKLVKGDGVCPSDWTCEGWTSKFEEWP